MTEGDTAWTGLLIYVILYDAWALIHGRETLSASYYRALQHPLRRWPTLLLHLILTLHLLHLIPERFDPLRAPLRRPDTGPS